MKNTAKKDLLDLIIKPLSLAIILMIISGIIVILVVEPKPESEVAQHPTGIGWAVAQSGSDSISENSGVYVVKWHQSHNFGVAITSYKDIKVGDQILIERYSVDYTGSIQYIQYVTKWKPSGVTSW